MSSRLSDLELRAWQALLHAHQDITRKLDAELRAEHDLSMNEYDVLLRLARAPDGTLRMTTIAERVMMSPSGLTRVVDRLVEGELVARSRFDGDARVMLARLTDRGRKVLREAARTHLRGIHEHYTGRLTEGQLHNVASALEVVAGRHQTH